MLDLKYGRIDIPGAPADEPCVLLRAQDVFASAALRSYQSVAEGSVSVFHSYMIQRAIEAFQQWPVKKIPDTNRGQCQGLKEPGLDPFKDA